MTVPQPDDVIEGRVGDPPTPAELAVMRADVTDLEEATAAARRTAWGWAVLWALVFVAYAVYAVDLMGIGGLVLTPFMLLPAAFCCVPAWYRYRVAEGTARRRRRELEGVMTGGDRRGRGV